MLLRPLDAPRSLLVLASLLGLQQRPESRRVPWPIPVADAERLVISGAIVVLELLSGGSRSRLRILSRLEAL
jgi:hypothetical protein